MIYSYYMFKFCIPLLLTFAAFAYAEQTQRQFLSGVDKDNTVSWQFKINGGRKSGSWQPIDVPSNWEMQGFGTYHYSSDWVEGEKAPDTEAIYRYTFNVSPTWNNKRIRIYFGGVMTDTLVKINGQIAGDIHQGGFYEFSYDITPLLQIGEPNVLEVVVNRYSANKSVNLAERRADFWMFSGIYRPVWLEAVPQEYIASVAIDAQHDGSIHIETALTGINNADNLEVQIKEINGKKIGKPLIVRLNKDQSIARVQAQFNSIHTWTEEKPYRYQLQLQLKKSQKVIHQLDRTFGFRTVEIRPGDGLYVNGKKIRLRGVNRHTIWPTSGRTTSRELSVQDVSLIKQMNMNAVRMAHYPPDSHFLEVTDELGLYVIDELTGWQDAYDTNVGKKLVRELIVRDQNHPSIIMWANGNEGGWNTNLDDDFAKWDVQNRPVIHPWANFGGIDTDHYEPYNCCPGRFFQGRDLFMPTEFLHSLYDGGAAAGLDDWWNLMLDKPLAIGGFLWAFADEGIVRDDRGGKIDVAGNRAPDGIVGPFREKEGSFFAIKEIWSPVYLPLAEKEILDNGFTGKLEVHNRYDFTNLNEVKFTWELLRVARPNTEGEMQVQSQGKINSTSIAPGDKASLVLNLPSNWLDNDLLLIQAKDKMGMEIYTWSWALKTPEEASDEILSTTASTTKPSVQVTNKSVILNRGDLAINFSLDDGLLKSVTKSNTKLNFSNGPRVLHGNAKLNTLTHGAVDQSYVVEATYEGTMQNLHWELMANGWLKLNYKYYLDGGSEVDYLGVSFDFPEEEVKSVRWFGKGPYRVWKNRLKGVEYGIWNKNYNDTITGMDWSYPEFKGFHSNIYWMTITTSTVPVHILTAKRNLFVGLFTPREAPTGETDPKLTHVDFPPGDITFLQGIPPIGTKFNEAFKHGPSGQKYRIPSAGQAFDNTIYFYFGDL